MGTGFEFWWRWLVCATCAITAFGLSMVVLPGPTQRLFNILYLASPSGNAVFEAPAVSYITFVSAVLGATMVGWSVALLFVLFGSFRYKQPDAWRTFAVSLIAWFIPDTSFSLWSGFWQNAILNTIMLLVFAIPLAATYATFQVTRNKAL